MPVRSSHRALALTLAAGLATALLAPAPIRPSATVQNATVPNATVPDATVPDATVPAATLAAASVPAAGLTGAAAANYAPTSRTLAPVAVYATAGTVSNPNNVLSNADTRLAGLNSSVTLDFGKEVGGLVTLSFHATSGAGQQVGLAFTESSLYVGRTSDASNGGSGTDGAIFGAAPASGSYTMPSSSLRGGFRYLTVFLNSTGWVDLYRVSLQYSPAPGLADPSAYPNYFSSNDDLLNRIWYAGAYTVQTNTIAPNQGRVWGPPASGWNNSATVGTGTSVLTDGAKRDRTVWPGDLGISVPTAYVSTNDMASTRNALQTLYNAQQASGELPYAGPQVSFYGSDTYHTWTLLGTSLYYSYTADRAFLDSIWSKYKLGLAFITAKIDGTGLVNVTGTADWARGGQGGENIEANALLYAALVGGADMATVEGDPTLATSYRGRAARLKAAANSLLWDAGIGMYRDNPGSGLHPQDGNSLAVWNGLTDSPAKATAIAGNLAAQWNSFGARTPEKGGNIATFPGSMEVHAHFAASDDQRGLDLIRREWGYMLDSPIGTRSTFWEGFKADGTFDYNGSYMSLSHGWATGPTSALTFDVLGTAPQTGGFRFVPHPGDLTHVEGRITLPQGAVNASWSRDVAAGTLRQQVNVPAGTTATIGIPKLSGGNVSVTVNGAVVWSNSTFTARPGITAASQDPNYVYLTGVAPGSYDLTSSGIGQPAELPAGFTRCAGEAETCSFTGTRVVAYGAGSYTYRTVAASTPCATAAFGIDPAYGVGKSCYVAPLGGPGGYTSCAAENATCAFTGTRRVAYGANGAFNYALVTGGVGCTNAVFGDPIPNVVKGCYLPPAAAPTGGWTQCAAEGSTCPAVAGQPIAYGAYGAFSYTSTTGATLCVDATFGDPVPDAVKACYVRSGPPGGYATTCAAENGSCGVTGLRTVAYGAAGRFVYRSFSGAITCSSAAFGADPLFGVAKSCYLTP